MQGAQGWPPIARVTARHVAGWARATTNDMRLERRPQSDVEFRTMTGHCHRCRMGSRLCVQTTIWVQRPRCFLPLANSAAKTPASCFATTTRPFRRIGPLNSLLRRTSGRESVLRRLARTCPLTSRSPLRFAKSRSFAEDRPVAARAPSQTQGRHQGNARRATKTDATPHCQRRLCRRAPGARRRRRSSRVFR